MKNLRYCKAMEKGFTLLEVMVALTITGFALGGLFGVVAGNKQLAWRSEAALIKTILARARINSSQLNDGQGEVFISFENDDFDLLIGEELDAPIRKTQSSQHTLRKYQLLDASGVSIAGGTYWVELDFPE